MSDLRVRERERELRAAAHGGTCSHEHLERLALEQIRAGARDPRIDPRKGDWLAAKSSRDVVSVWPRALAEGEHVFRDDGSRLSAHSMDTLWLHVGTPIGRPLAGPAAWASGARSGLAGPRDLFFPALLDGRWQPFRCYSHDTLGEEDGWLALRAGPCGEATHVTFRETRGRSTRQPLVSVDLDLWRKWARAARVRRVAPAPGCDHRHGLVPCPACGRSV